MNSKEIAKSYLSFMVNIANADGDFCEEELARIEGGSIQFLKLQGLNIEEKLVAESINSPYSMEQLNSVFKELPIEYKLIAIIANKIVIGYFFRKSITDCLFMFFNRCKLKESNT